MKTVDEDSALDVKLNFDDSENMHLMSVALENNRNSAHANIIDRLLAANIVTARALIAGCLLAMARVESTVERGRGRAGVIE